MKIAVYTIAKNEEQFVQRWAESCKEADYRIILDTGSTDKTIELAEECGVVVHAKQFNPWRFDHARNHALSLVPDDADYCIALDMDEVLIEGWRGQLEAVHADITRPRYKYVWSWNADGSEGLVYGGDKIHARHGYVWKHPVHEVITPICEEFQTWIDLQIHHHPDSSKSRAQYLPLLELAVSEEPNDDRNQFYLGREYYFHGRYDDAKLCFEAHLKLSNWAPERAASCRYLAKMFPNMRQSWLWRGIAEDPSRRETWVDLALYGYESADWWTCLYASKKAVGITEKPLDYLCEAFAWGVLPYDLAALAAYNLGLSSEAVEFGSIACEIAPDDERLISNLKFYRKSLVSQ